MNIFRREKSSTAPTPVVPPRPSKDELEHPITHSQTPKDAGMTSGSEKNHEITSDPATKVGKKPILGSEVQPSFGGYLINVLFCSEERCDGCDAEGQPLQVQRTGKA